VFCTSETEDPDYLLHKSINKHQAIYTKTESLLDSIHAADTLSIKEEWKSTLNEIMDHTRESADALHRARRTILRRRAPDLN
jgi:hypothetical protein